MFLSCLFPVPDSPERGFFVPEPQENCLRESLTGLQKSIIMLKVRFSRKLPEFHIIYTIS